MSSGLAFDFAMAGDALRIPIDPTSTSSPITVEDDAVDPIRARRLGLAERLEELLLRQATLCFSERL